MHFGLKKDSNGTILMITPDEWREGWNGDINDQTLKVMNSIITKIC